MSTVPDAHLIMTQLADVRMALPKITDELQTAEQRLATATRHLKESEARNYLEARGPVKEREMQVVIATALLVGARDDAAAVVNYLKRRRADLELIQTNLQSTAKLIEVSP